MRSTEMTEKDWDTSAQCVNQVPCAMALETLLDLTCLPGHFDTCGVKNTPLPLENRQENTYFVSDVSHQDGKLMLGNDFLPLSLCVWFHRW